MSDFKPICLVQLRRNYGFGWLLIFLYRRSDIFFKKLLDLVRRDVFLKSMVFVFEVSVSF